jgi:hypothetical protein
VAVRKSAAVSVDIRAVGLAKTICGRQPRCLHSISAVGHSGHGSRTDGLLSCCTRMLDDQSERECGGCEQGDVIDGGKEVSRSVN